MSELKKHGNESLSERLHEAIYNTRNGDKLRLLLIDARDENEKSVTDDSVTLCHNNKKGEQI